ncbi:hypothetical protein [Curtobacterium sp. NPDC089689]|uniref:hypothetical protein n=1 Tax=Curtobacterium sp. NPDC089689 TaxID=3363968 RepID=UPI003811D18F
MTARDTEVLVTRLDEAATVALERREPPGRRYAQWAADAQARGELTVLVAWVGTEPSGALRIGVAQDNPDARRLYERAGYVATGEVEEYDYTFVGDDGRWVTAHEASVYLAKDLRRGD